MGGKLLGFGLGCWGVVDLGMDTVVGRKDGRGRVWQLMPGIVSGAYIELHVCWNRAQGSPQETYPKSCKKDELFSLMSPSRFTP